MGQGQVGCEHLHGTGTGGVRVLSTFQAPSTVGTGSGQGYCAIFSTVGAASTCLQQDKTYVQYLHVLFNVCKQTRAGNTNKMQLSLPPTSVSNVF